MRLIVTWRAITKIDEDLVQLNNHLAEIFTAEKTEKGIDGIVDSLENGFSALDLSFLNPWNHL